jgi:hypothetical protein
MVRLAVVATAAAARTMQLGIGIKRVVKAGHNVTPHRIEKWHCLAGTLRTFLFAPRPGLVHFASSVARAPLLPEARKLGRFDDSGRAVSVFPLVSYSGSVPTRQKIYKPLLYKRFLNRRKNAPAHWPVS